tara:strand:- start:3784 stop:4818 length:1035 start_codon:yes stop_codon:yes gene_type:complete
MIIEKIKIIPYQLSFKKEYKNSQFSINKRNGWIIQISSNGISGYGDACPLDGFNVESYSQSGYGLEGFKLSLLESENIEFDELLCLSEAHGELQPSVEFAIQSAIYDLASKLNGIPLNKYLNKDASNLVKVNYYSDSPVKPFRGMVVKLKIIDSNLFNQLDMIEQVSDKFKGMAKFRLDLNESYDLPRAIRFCKMLENKPIDYIEQPLPRDNLEDMYELSLHTDIPIAVDESINDIESINKVLDNQCADIFILKPMAIGGISKLYDMIELIKSSSKKFNISSLLESNIARSCYLHLASALKIDDECGIATDFLFRNDLCEFPAPFDGEIHVGSSNGIGINEINI